MSNKIRFSTKQQEALSLKKENMLVSAGAGSGKTAVLVERLYQIFTTKNIDLDRVLVLTFSRAGAQEFKDRIKHKLINDPTHTHKAFALDNADITTFDAYALKIVRKYGYLLDIPQAINNLSENIEHVLIKRFFDEVLSEYYQNPSDMFVSFTKHFLTLDDKPLFNLVLELHKETNLKIDSEHYLDKFVATYYANEAFDKNYHELNQYVIKTLRESAALIKTLNNEKHVALYEEFLENYGLILSFDDYMKSQTKFQKRRSPNNARVDFPEDNESVDQLLKNIKFLTSLHALESRDVIYTNFQKDRQFATLLIEIYKKILDKLTVYKKSHHVYTFSDISKLAYRLVLMDEVKKELKSQYDYILIDEYQDTSDIQEEFIQQISTNNVYMVGDIKQSIYGFRNANSDIFRAKFQKYSRKEGGVLVDLNDNYRSRKDVLHAINAMLKDIMSDEYGGADYKKDHVIAYGNKVYDTFDTSQSKGLQVLNYEIPPKLEEVDDSDERRKEKVSSQVYEAQTIINDIKKKIAEKFLVYDPKLNSMRQIEYRDITILSPFGTRFAELEHLFKAAGIPLVYEREEVVIENKVLIAFKNLLVLYDSYLQEVKPNSYRFRFAAASFLRSFIIGYTDQKLFELLNDLDALHGDRVMNQIMTIATNSKNSPISEIVKTLIETFDFYGAIYRLGSMAENTYKLNEKIREIEVLESLGYSISDVVTLYNDMNEINEPQKIRRFKLVDNAVTIMTMHSSKGLEFPVVYYMDLKSNFFQKERAKKIKIDSKYGLILPLAGGSNSLTHILSNINYTKSLISEKIRLLYVALTRARELMIVIHQQVNNAKVSTIADVKSMIDLLRISPFYLSHIEMIEMPFIESEKKPELPPCQEERKLQRATIKPTFKTRDVPVEIRNQDKVNETILRRGSLLHRYIELYNFDDERLDYIPNKEDRHHIKELLALPLFKYANEENVYREYVFKDENNKENIIDFFILGTRQITLIDFKLVNIDHEKYDEQIKRYAKHLTKVFNKPVEAYLVSIINFNSRKVDVYEEN